MSASAGSSDSEADGSPFGERPSKVLLDVMASRMVDNGVNLSSSSSSSAVDLAEEASQLLGASMSLSSIARAEQFLKHNIAIVKGGSHVEFSKSDIERIRDPEVLQFLEENSSLFHKYVRPSSSPSREGSRRGEGNTVTRPSAAADLEANILDLQREIDTFITAVDEDGRNYRIRLGEDGNVLVPIGEDSDATSDDGDSAVRSETPVVPKEDDQLQLVDVDADTLAHENNTEEAGKPATATKPAAQSLPRRSVLGTTPRPKPTRPQPQQRHVRRLPPPPVCSGRLKNANQPSKPLMQGGVDVEGAQQTVSSSRLHARDKKRLVTNKPPSISPRTFRELSQAEEQRLSALLSQDWRATLAEKTPYHCSDTQTTRLAEIDASLALLRTVRGFSVPEVSLGGTESDGAEATTALSGSTAHRLGNAYMREAAAAAKREKRLRQINARLVDLHGEAEKMALEPDVDIPADLLQLRPSWAQEREVGRDASLYDRLGELSEEEIQRMLTEAREENGRAALRGVGLTTAPGALDPYAALRESLAAVRDRAVALVCDSEANPLALSIEESAEHDVASDIDE